MQSGVHRPPPVKDAASPPSAAEKEFIQDGDFEEGLDRRKTTPPDLLALSNMYFDRKLNIAGSGGGRVFVSPTNRQVRELRGTAETCIGCTGCTSCSLC